MQKITTIIFVAFLFIGCRTTGGVSTDLIDGAGKTDNAISGLQQQQGDSAAASAGLAETNAALAEQSGELAGESAEISDGLSELIAALEPGEGNDSEFADIIQRVQNRESVDYLGEGVKTPKIKSDTK